MIPRDAPAKVDYGDIDFLVEGVRLQASIDEIWTAVKDSLGAEFHLPRGGSQSYAVKHPTIPEAYVQVDVELSPGNGTPDSAELFEWTRFMKGDSDLLQIVGVSHRPLGLTCNDQGLHIRVEEIEPYNKKRALLFLTRDPNQAMDFYGFDTNKYWNGFTDEMDLFAWATSGRFFSHEVFQSRIEKSNDRSRQAKRPMYRRFVEEYVPAHVETGAARVWTRQEVLHEALQSFNKHTEYDAMMADHRTKESEEALWKDIREVLPVEGNSLSNALKALRRWVNFQDGKPYITSNPLEEAVVWKILMAETTRDNVLRWVEDNWKEAKALEKARVNAARAAATTTL